MNKRLMRISSYIDENDIVIDVGCDSAHLGEILAKRKIKSYASDINESIINNAKERIKYLKLEKYVTLYVSDGLKSIKNTEIDTLVIAGMGARKIIDIIKNAYIIFKKIILVPNKDYELLRTNVIKMGYQIKTEEIILDKNKFYNLIVFIRGKKKYNKKDLFLGINHVNKELYIKRNNVLLEKYQKIYNINKSKKILEKINLLKKS